MVSGESVDLSGSSAVVDNVQHIVRAKTACLTEGIKVGTVRYENVALGVGSRTYCADLGGGDTGTKLHLGCNLNKNPTECYFDYEKGGHFARPYSPPFHANIRILHD